MPVKQTRKGCYKYGNTGKEYCGRNAKDKAIKQGKAIKANSNEKSR